jgi:hypothetical protein
MMLEEFIPKVKFSVPSITNDPVPLLTNGPPHLTATWCHLLRFRELSDDAYMNELSSPVSAVVAVLPTIVHFDGRTLALELSCNNSLNPSGFPSGAIELPVTKLNA